MEKSEMKQFGQRIINLRKECRESQESLLETLGVTQQTLSRYEKGERQASLDFVIKAAKHYNVTADYLLGLSDCKSVEQDMQTVCKATGLSESSIETLQDVVSDTEHTKYSAYTIDFLNGILEDESSPFSASILANMMQKVVIAKVKTKMIKNRIDVNELEREKNKRPMNAYETADIFDLQDKREQEDLALLRFSKLLNVFAETLANKQLEQEGFFDAEHHETDK